MKITGLEPAEALYVRVEGEGIGPFEIPVESDSALVPSLVPGTYALALCFDAGCVEPVALWDGVVVRRGKTEVLFR